MFHNLSWTLALIFLVVNIVSANEDDVEVEIEGLSNFFNPFNWFGEDKSASEAPYNEDIPLIDLGPQPVAERLLKTDSAPEPNLVSLSESLNEKEIPEVNNNEVRIVGSPRESAAPKTPLNINGGLELARNNPNNIGRFSGSPNGNYGQPDRGQPFGSPLTAASPYGSPAYGNHASYGRSPYGNSPYSNSPYSNSPFGHSSYGTPPRARPQPANHFNHPSSNMYRSKIDKRKGKLTLKPKEQPTH